MIRILLVDDHKLVREALISVLEKEPDITVVGQAGDKESALALCRESLPDVVLMDISFPDGCGIDMTRQVIAEVPSVRVIALSSHIDRSFVTRMLEAGAIGYINKAAGRDELLQGIRAVADGAFYLSQNVAALMNQSTGHDRADGARPHLGRRETVVLILVAEGLTSAQIAARLHIATGTVEVHRRNIMQKLGLHSIAELTKYALRQGLISH